jgi:hypothetical protein
MLAAVIVLAFCNVGFIGFEIWRHILISVEQDLLRESGVIYTNSRSDFSASLSH